MLPCGHWWGYYPDTLSCSQVFPTHLKIRHTEISSMGAKQGKYYILVYKCTIYICCTGYTVRLSMIFSAVQEKYSVISKNVSKYWITRETLQNQGGISKNTYGLVNIGVCKFSFINRLCIFQCMGILCELQKEPLKFHTIYFTHTLKDTILIQCWKFSSCQIHELLKVIEMPPNSNFVISIVPPDGTAQLGKR